MFWMKKEAREEVEDLTVPERVAAEAERLYRHERMHCAEAVLASVKRQFAPEIPDQVLAAALAFGGGSGAGCICGAVSGGTMALGLVLNDKKAASALTRDLHEWFTKEYGATCCKILTAHGKKGCLALTARVAGKVAEMLVAKGR